MENINFRIYGRPVGSGSLPHLVDYKIINTKAMDDSLGFPKTYSYYSNSDMEIIEPLNSPLKQGTNVKFKVKTTTYSDLYIINNGNYHKMDKGSNGLFEKAKTAKKEYGSLPSPEGVL